ncbi:hypothetical protein ACVWZZ_006019 [Bradyrhizobium sp. LM6.10]
MRGSGRFKAIKLRNDPIGRKTAQSYDLLAIGLSFNTGLNWFPIIRAEKMGKACRKDSFAGSCICARSPRSADSSRSAPRLLSEGIEHRTHLILFHVERQ